MSNQEMVLKMTLMAMERDFTDNHREALRLLAALPLSEALVVIGCVLAEASVAVHVAERQGAAEPIPTPPEPT